MTFKGSADGSDLCYRDFKDPDDHSQVCEMCKHVYGGRDHVPQALRGYGESSLCFPRVIAKRSEILAFCNVRLLEGDDEYQDVVYIEAVRVVESVRGTGLGTMIFKESISDALHRNDSQKPIRFLSTTIPEQVVMRRIFEKEGLACRGYVEMWPSDSIRRDVKEATNGGARLLDVLGVSEFIPQSAIAAVPLWAEVRDPKVILRIMRDLREVGSSFLQPGYYSVDTAIGASAFAQSKFSKQEGRSVWMLEREGQQPVLLFIRRQSVDPSSPTPDQVLSACVVDTDGAECCVAFAASRRDLNCFFVAFDPAVSAEAIQKSSFLSRIKTSTYMIYERNH